MLLLFLKYRWFLLCFIRFDRIEEVSHVGGDYIMDCAGGVQTILPNRSNPLLRLFWPNSMLFWMIQNSFKMKKIKGQLYPCGRHIRFRCLYAKPHSNRSIVDLNVPKCRDLLTLFKTGNHKGNVERLTTGNSVNRWYIHK